MNKGKFNIINPNSNLYDRIILAIQKEKENQTNQIRKFVIFFTGLFCLSATLTITSIVQFIKAWQNSGLIYLFRTITSDFSLFLSLWKYFTLAFIESFPIINLIIFIFCLAFTTFSLRLIFYKKYLLIKTLIK